MAMPIQEIKLSDLKTEAELAAIASTGYRESASTKLITKLSSKHKDALTPAELSSYFQKLANLTGPKTITGRLKSLSNLVVANQGVSVPPPADSGNSLEENPTESLYLICDGDNDRNFVDERVVKYRKDYEINSSADETILIQIVTEELNIRKLRDLQRRYLIATKESPGQKKVPDPAGKIDAAVKRLKSLIESLGADRRLRTGGKDNSAEDNIASIAAKYDAMGQLSNNAEEKAWAERDSMLQDKLAESQAKQEAELKKTGL
jgi:hypothetical protein